MSRTTNASGYRRWLHGPLPAPPCEYQAEQPVDERDSGADDPEARGGRIHDALLVAGGDAGGPENRTPAPTSNTVPGSQNTRVPRSTKARTAGRASATIHSWNGSESMTTAAGERRASDVPTLSTLATGRRRCGAGRAIATAGWRWRWLDEIERRVDRPHFTPEVYNYPSLEQLEL